MTAGVWLYIALASIGGLAIGLLLGLWRTMALTREVALKDAELRSRAAADVEREQILGLASERLGTAFNQLADRQFQNHSETFLKLARETLSVHTERAKGDLSAREQAIDGLVAPIREALARAERQMQELDKSRSETHGSISRQLEALAASQLVLSAETRNLVSALRRPEVRGQWGEITLRRLVELAGMVEHCDFVTQSHQPTESGAIRPDMVIHLPEVAGSRRRRQDTARRVPRSDGGADRGRAPHSARATCDDRRRAHPRARRQSLLEPIRA